jgi:uncharacterized protein (DUF362 family)
MINIYTLLGRIGLKLKGKETLPMRRRDFLLAPLPLQVALSQSAIPGTKPASVQPQNAKPREWVTAAASRDTAPRVGLIPSTFAGTEEMDGRKIRALARPAPLRAPLSAAQLNDMLRLAVELGGGRRGGLVTAIAKDDWVVIKVNIQNCGATGVVTDPRLVASVLGYLVERRLGRRFTIVEGAPCRAASSVWDSKWDGQFNGVTYRWIVQTMSKQHPSLRFELLDLNTAPSLEMPVEGRVFATRNQPGIYRIPRVLRECDKVISIAPLATMPGTGVALSIMNYLGFAPAEHYGEGKHRLARLGDPGEVAVDLFSFHPADYAIVGGTFGAESDGGASGTTRLRRHNVLIAGTNAPAVDAVGAAVMGFDSSAIRHLDLAVQHGYGVNDAYSIWTRGAEIEEVKTRFEKPPQVPPAV